MSQVSTSVNSPQALDGVRVLDITGPAGFYCTKLMADLGADVVRIDPPDPEESGPGPFFGTDPEHRGKPDRSQSLYRWHYHTNKRSVLLDMESSSGRRVFDSLLSVADVLVDTYRPSEAAALGLDSERLRRDYPSLVHTTITGFGPDGPYVDYKATDIVALAMGGLMAITGYPEAPPNQLGGEQADQMASLHAAVGTLLALLSRDLDGTGRDVQVAMQDCVSMATLQTANFNFYTWFGTVRSRAGLNHAGSRLQPQAVRRWMPHTLYACKDGWIAYATIGAPPDNWAHFVTWLSGYGAEQELGDARFEDPDVQRAEQDRINAVTAQFTAQHTAQELYHSAQRLSILCTPVQTVADLVKDEQLLDRGYFVEVEHPELDRTFTYPGAPYILSETPWQLKSRAPLVGEHTLDVLSDWLDLSSEESAELLNRKAPQIG
jgi:benzylsuccinate CoA-transferase BbsE subunit